MIMKYPEYRQIFKDAQWFEGHLCLQKGVYYKLVRVEGEKEKQLKQFTYEELDKKDKDTIKRVTKEREESDERLLFYFQVLLPARNKFIDYVRTNGKLVSRSNQSESEYWEVQSPKNGFFYKIRISGHIYPTGSMTNVSMYTLDTTDYDCRRFLELFNLQ